MAGIDLYGGDAQRIRDQYKTSLRRDASDDEVSGWLSGSYGGGGVDNWANQIATSDEAKRYQQPRTVGTNPDVSRPQVPETPPTPGGPKPGGGGGASTPPPQTPPAGGGGADQITQWYQQYLQRDPGADDVSKWLSGAYGWGNSGNMSGIQRGIMGSPEARGRGQTTGGTGGAPNSTPYTGFTPKYDYSAFNTGREQKPKASAKDAFAMLSNQAPPPPFQDKKALAAWFNQYIAPGMNSLGHKVLSVSDDGFTYENHEGRFFVDYAQNAGAASGSMLQRLQWGASPADAATYQRYAAGGAGSGPVFNGGAQGGPQGGPPGGVPQSQPVSGSPPPTGGPTPAMPPFTPFEMPQDVLHQWDANVQGKVAQWYWTHLGRMPGQDEIISHAGNPGGLAAVEQLIRDSQEAKEYAARRPVTPTTDGTGGGNVGGTGGGNGGVTNGPYTPPSTGGGAPSGMPGTQYNDPHTQYLEQLMQQMIQSRMTPVNDPNRAMYEQLLKQRGDALGQAEPQLQKLMGYLEQRQKDLQGNGYTGAEGEAIRTGALDPIETDRQAARKRVMERLSARGLTPDSGIAQQALLEVDKAFDAMRGQTQTALTTNDLARREGRKQRAETIGAQLVDIPQARSREQLDVFGALNQLSQLARQEDESREREAVGYGGALADLGPQRLQLAMQAAGMGGNPASMGSLLTQMAGLNQNAALYGQQNQNAKWSALGTVLETLMRSGK